MEKVLIRNVENYDSKVEDFVREVFDEFELKDKRVLVKPNFLLAKDGESGVITHPVVIEAVLKVVLEKGGKPFIYEIPSIGSALSAAKKCGVDKICLDLDVEIKAISEFEFVENLENVHFKKLAIPVEVAKADFIVNLAKLKTHSLMGLTLGVKNMFGLVKPDLRNNMHFKTGRDRDTFAHMLIDVFSFVKPDLTILDGVVGMEGNGPTNGVPRRFGVMCASKSAFALDSAVVKMLGKKDEEIPVQRIAEKRGLNVEFRVVGDHVYIGRAIKMPDSFTGSLGSAFGGFTKVFYPMFKGLFDAKPKIIYPKCVSCFNCMKICPAKAISVKDKKPWIDYSKCVKCFCCHEVCPEDAIEIHKTYLRKTIEKRFKKNLKDDKH